MICDNCNTDRLVSDFINNQKFCYHCVYRIKLQKSRRKRKPKPVQCRVCGGEVVMKKEVKKRQRTVFCSKECALRGHKEKIKNYWTRQITGEKYNKICKSGVEKHD